MSRVAVVSAGLRDPSSTKLLADRIADALHDPAGGATGVDVVLEVQHVEVRTLAHSIVDGVLTGFPSGALADALDDVAAADALVLVTPTFQASYSGLFKCFMDLVPAQSVAGKPVLLAATGGTDRHSLVIESALRPLAAYLGMVTVPTGVFAAMADLGRRDAAAPRDGAAPGGPRPRPDGVAPRGGLSERIERATGELRCLVRLGRMRMVPPDPSEAPTAPPVAFEALLRSVGHDPSAVLRPTRAQEVTGQA